MNATARPVIGITAYREQARFGVWNVPSVLLPADYAAKVEAAGGIAVVLPPFTHPEVLDRLDGLILAGGADVEPSRYGAAPEPATTGTRPDRDESELALLDVALERDVPILAICRGMQLLAIAAGGRLHQHLPDIGASDAHRPQLGTYGTHEVRVEPGTTLHALVGDRVDVCCHHHQGVADAGGLCTSARAADGVVEAVEHPERTFVIGVQWHPEVLEDTRLFDALTAAAAAAAAPA